MSTYVVVLEDVPNFVLQAKPTPKPTSLRKDAYMQAAITSCRAMG